MNLGTVLTDVSTSMIRGELSYLAGFVNPTRAQVKLIRKLRAEIAARRRATAEGDHYAKPWPVRS